MNTSVGAVEAIVDQVIEAGEVVAVAPQPAAARRTAPERKCGRPDDEEAQQENFGTDAAQAHARTLAEMGTLPIS